MLRQYGRAWGIDLTWSGLAYARDSGEQRCRPRLGRPPALSRGQFDLVTSFDVLYALDDADGAEGAR